jgi:hypothetical protein
MSTKTFDEKKKKNSTFSLGMRKISGVLCELNHHLDKVFILRK